MNTDLFLELTFMKVAYSQANRDADPPDLSTYDKLADEARERSHDR